MANKSKEVATTDPSVLSAGMLSRFTDAAASMVADDEGFIERQMEAILGATSVEEIFAQSEAKSLKNDINNGEKFTIRSAELRESTIANATLPAYAVMDTDIGPIMTGAVNVVAGVIRCTELGLFPVTVKKNSKVTKSGGEVIWLEIVVAEAPF